MWREVIGLFFVCYWLWRDIWGAEFSSLEAKSKRNLQRIGSLSSISNFTLIYYYVLKHFLLWNQKQPHLEDKIYMVWLCVFSWNWIVLNVRPLRKKGFWSRWNVTTGTRKVIKNLLINMYCHILEVPQSISFFMCCKKKSFCFYFFFYSFEKYLAVIIS